MSFKQLSQKFHRYCLSNSSLRSFTDTVCQTALSEVSPILSFKQLSLKFHRYCLSNSPLRSFTDIVFQTALSEVSPILPFRQLQCSCDVIVMVLSCPFKEGCRALLKWTGDWHEEATVGYTGRESTTGITWECLRRETIIYIIIVSRLEHFQVDWSRHAVCLRTSDHRVTGL